MLQTLRTIVRGITDLVRDGCELDRQMRVWGNVDWKAGESITTDNFPEIVDGQKIWCSKDQGSTWFVSENGNDANSGESPDEAFATIGHALDVSDGGRVYNLGNEPNTVAECEYACSLGISVDELTATQKMQALCGNESNTAAEWERAESRGHCSGVWHTSEGSFLEFDDAPRCPWCGSEYSGHKCHNCGSTFGSVHCGCGRDWPAGQRVCYDGHVGCGAELGDSLVVGIGRGSPMLECTRDWFKPLTIELPISASLCVGSIV